MSDFKIQPATRTGVKPLIVLYSESGCGKTYSALLLARGLAGPKGKIVVADSESKRASLYADVIPGSFETFDLGEPFSPARYIEAVETIEKWPGVSCGIIDSGSHEWEGPGGVLDMAGENEHKSGKAGLHNWRLPKLEHAKFVQRLLRISIPFVICLRAKYKTRQAKEDGRTVIIKDDYTSPIQAEDFIFESTCHGEILQDHSLHLTKASHPKLRDCFPTQGPIKIEHGALLAAWCNGTATKAPVLDRTKLLTELRDITSELHGWKKGMTAKAWQTAKGALQKWLVEKSGVEIPIDQMTPEQLVATITFVKGAIKV